MCLRGVLCSRSHKAAVQVLAGLRSSLEPSTRSQIHTVVGRIQFLWLRTGFLLSPWPSPGAVLGSSEPAAHGVFLLRPSHCVATYFVKASRRLSVSGLSAQAKLSLKGHA